MAGLGLALTAFLVLGISGLTDYRAGAAVLIFLQYGAQLFAGYVAGRLSPEQRIAHGGVAGIVMAAIGATIGAAAASATPIGFLVFAFMVAAISGSAGGALAEYRESARRGLP